MLFKIIYIYKTVSVVFWKVLFLNFCLILELFCTVSLPELLYNWSHWLFELFLHWNCFILYQSLNSIQKWEIAPLLLKLALRNRPLVNSRFISRPLALNWPVSHGLYMSVCMCQPNVPLISFILCFKMVGSLPLSGLAHLFRTCPTIRKWAWPCPCKPKTGLMGKYVYAKKGPGIEKLLVLLSRPQRHFLLVHVLVWKVY